MPKDKFIQIRVSQSLKERYIEALKHNGIDPDHAPTATDHLVGEIEKLVQNYEKKAKKTAAR